MGVAFRAGAKAEGQLVRIGGWECLWGVLPREARWFSITLTRSTAPWAFLRGEPFRTIAALEMFATLVSVRAFSDRWPGSGKGAITLSGITDNLGNTFVLSRMMTSKFPLVVILSELTLQLRDRGMEMDLLWTPRDQNEEAGALTNGAFTGFTAAHRVEVDLGPHSWKILPAAMKEAEDIYEKVKERRAARRDQGGIPLEAQGGGRRAGQKLRETDPW